VLSVQRLRPWKQVPSLSGYNLIEELVRPNSVRVKRSLASQLRLPVEGLDLYQTEFVKRRGGEKNSAQPCFPVPDILSPPFAHPQYAHGKQLSVQFYTLAGPDGAIEAGWEVTGGGTRKR
jgi:hypothetical protein